VSNIEAELIRRAQSADAEAFCQLAKGYERRIYLLAFHYCHNPQDAEDLSQDVWLKAYQALNSFRGDSTFYTWLRKITINCFLNHQRSRRFNWRGQTTDISFLEVDSIAGDEHLQSSSNSETTLHNKILAKRVMQALSELTPPQRLIFLLKHYEGMTYEEIAKAVGCSTGSAKKSVFRAVAKIRERLEVDAQSPTTFPALQTEIEIGA
jgi:RNA polymerase sigma-70 factor, ECF subfamily